MRGKTDFLLIDVNLLLYAKVSNYPQHKAAASWFEQQVNEQIRMGIPWANILAFLRIVTNPRVYRVPLSINDAQAQIDEWLNLPNVWIPLPTGQHRRILSQLLFENQLTGNLIPDAHLAALAIEHGLEVCTTDTDFAHFSGCKWRNPLQEP
ncbi:MAG: type II toxin-antitoxin system VapC family toxin [Cyanobacteria bacterium P01_F01_bin.3]